MHRGTELDFSGHARFGEGNGEAALGAIVGALHQSGADQSPHRILNSEFVVVIELGRRPGFNAVDGEQVMRGAELVTRFAKENDDISGRFEKLGRDMSGILNDADHSDRGRGIDRARRAFVVKTDIAAGDRRIKFPAGLGQALDGLAELEEIFRLVRIAEIQVVGDGQRDGSGAGNIPRGFCNGYLRSFAGILPAIDGIAVGAGSEDFPGFANNEYSGIRAW